MAAEYFMTKRMDGLRRKREEDNEGGSARSEGDEGEKRATEGALSRMSTFYTSQRERRARGRFFHNLSAFHRIPRLISMSDFPGVE